MKLQPTIFELLIKGTQCWNIYKPRKRKGGSQHQTADTSEPNPDKKKQDRERDRQISHAVIQKYRVGRGHAVESRFHNAQQLGTIMTSNMHKQLNPTPDELSWTRRQLQTRRTKASDSRT